MPSRSMRMYKTESHLIRSSRNSPSNLCWSATNMSKLILVIGGTGAQGFEVVKALLGSKKQQFSICVLSRNPDSERVQELFNDLSVQMIKG